MDTQPENSQTSDTSQKAPVVIHSLPPIGQVATLMLGAYLILLALILAYLLMKFFPPIPWPITDPNTNSLVGALGKNVFGKTVYISLEESFLIIVMVCGAMGSYLRSVVAFATRAEEGRMPHLVWIWWCILQTFIGMILAVLFYFVVRGTVYIKLNVEELNPFLMFGTAGLVGMFSPQATEKLAGYFGTVKVGK